MERIPSYALAGHDILCVHDIFKVRRQSVFAGGLLIVDAKQA